MNNNSTALWRFRPENIDACDVVAAIGYRHVTVFPDLLVHHRTTFPLVVVFSDNIATLAAYERHCRWCFVYSSFRIAVLDYLYEHQQKFAPGDPSVLVILDGCILEPLDNSRVRDLWLRGRHRNIGLWIDVPDVQMLSRGMRINLDWALCFAERSQKSRELIHSDWMPDLDASLLHAVFDFYTKQGRCLVARVKQSNYNSLTWYSKLDTPGYAAGHLPKPVLLRLAAPVPEGKEDGRRLAVGTLRIGLGAKGTMDSLWDLWQRNSLESKEPFKALHILVRRGSGILLEGETKRMTFPVTAFRISARPGAFQRALRVLSKCHLPNVTHLEFKPSLRWMRRMPEDRINRDLAHLAQLMDQACDRRVDVTRNILDPRGVLPPVLSPARLASLVPPLHLAT
jgi:hypothetical protein